MKPPNKEIQYLNNNHHDIYIRYFSDDNVHICSKLHRTSHKFTMYYKTKVKFFFASCNVSGHNIFLHNANDNSNNKILQHSKDGIKVAVINNLEAKIANAPVLSSWDIANTVLKKLYGSGCIK